MSLEPPSSPKGEAAAALIKGAVSAIPYVGGIISEVGDLYFNPLEKRKQRWMGEVAKAIVEIEQRFTILPEQLENDERFVSFLYQATLIALKNHRNEKISALRAAVVSTANPHGSAEDIAFQFLRYVDELTPTHLFLLAGLHRHATELSHLKKLEEMFTKLSALLPLTIDRVVFRSFLHDLDGRFLIRFGDLEDFSEFESKESVLLWEESTVRKFGITSFGKEFLAFIHG